MNKKAEAATNSYRLAHVLFDVQLQAPFELQSVLLHSVHYSRQAALTLLLDGISFLSLQQLAIFHLTLTVLISFYRHACQFLLIN
jgi:hypothetical protein